MGVAMGTEIISWNSPERLDTLLLDDRNGNYIYVTKENFSPTLKM